MIDLVYPLKESGGPDSNFELRYALRSIARHLKMQVRQVFVFGFRPAWMSRDVVHFPMRDRGDKAMNLRDKYARMVAIDEISDPFLLLDDDHTFLADTDTIPLYTRGDLSALVDEYKGRTHGVYLANCMRALQERGLPTRSYQIHYPMLISKPILAAAVEMMDKPMVMGSLYGNLAGGPSFEVTADFKLNTSHDFARLKGGPFFSLSDRGIRVIGVRSFVINRFQEVSPWELAATRSEQRRLRRHVASVSP